MPQFHTLRRAVLRPRAGGPATALFLTGLALSACTALGSNVIGSTEAQAAGTAVDGPAGATMPSGSGTVRDALREDGTGRPSQSRIENADPGPAPGRADASRMDEPAAAAMPTGTGTVRDMPRNDGTGRPSQSRIDNTQPAPEKPRSALPERTGILGDRAEAAMPAGNRPSVKEAHPEAAHKPNENVSAPRRLAPSTAVTPEDGAGRTNPKDHLPDTMRRGG